MNNRLAALRDGGGDDPTYDDSGDALADPGKGSQYAQPKFMETFFKDVESVKDDISQIRFAPRMLVCEKMQHLTAHFEQGRNERCLSD
jgi:hypothetical protein